MNKKSVTIFRHNCSGRGKGFWQRKGGFCGSFWQKNGRHWRLAEECFYDVVAQTDSFLFSIERFTLYLSTSIYVE